MKQLLYLTTLFMVLLVTACKKETKKLNPDPCEGIACNGDSCLNGVCICAIGFTGTFCETAPSDSREGVYLVYGTYDYGNLPIFAGDTSYNITADTLHIVRIDDINIRTNYVARNLTYNGQINTNGVLGFDSKTYIGSTWSEATVHFFTGNPDSVYCDFHEFSHTYGWKYLLYGKKIH